MIHAKTLVVGMQVDIGWNSMKDLGERGSESNLTVEALGYDWVVFRKNGKPFAATFESNEASARFMQEVEIL